MGLRFRADIAFGLVLTILAALLAACGGSADTTDPLVIGPDGGVIEGPGGLVLEIPLGALSETVTIVISESAKPAQTELTQVSRFYRIEPLATTFAIPATLRIPYNPEAIGEGQRERDIRLYVGQDINGTATMLDGGPETETGIAVGKTTTLGIFGAAVPPPDVPPGAPSLSAPSQVDFGLVAIEGSESQNLIFGNTGQSDLILDSVTLENATGFALPQAPAAGTIIPAQSQIQVALDFSPTSQADYAATLVIKSNDPTSPELRIPVTGRGAGQGRLAADPERLDFGGVLVGESKPLTLNLTNSGSGKLKLFAITLSSASVFAVQSPTLPTFIAPGDSLALELSFSPAQAEDYQVTLRVESDDLEQSRLDVTISGTGLLTPADGDLDNETDAEADAEDEIERELDSESETDGDLETENDPDLDAETSETL